MGKEGKGMPAAADTTIDLIRAFIRSELVERVWPSLAVAVAYQGEIVWEEGFGWADRERRISATAHTPYSLASISKPITATALMVLRERGLLDLDRPLDDYLGPAKLTARVGDAKDATVRRVANHTAGLPLHYHFFPEDEPPRPPPREETIRRYANLVTAPGERFRYSNLGYGLLDHVIARLSGKGYADFLRDEVLLPLGMNRSALGIGPGLEPYAAARYRGRTERLPFYDFDHPGGSAVFASAHDLARFGLFHLKARLPDQKAILPDAALDEMQRPTVAVDAATGCGIAWRIGQDSSGQRRVSHDGGMDGVSTTLELFPEDGLVVAVLANAAGDIPRRVAEKVRMAFLPGESVTTPASATSATEAARFAPPADMLGTWQGSVSTHTGELPFVLTFHPDGDVYARLGSQLTTLLNDIQLKEGWLTGRMAGDIGMEDANRRPYLLHADLKLRGDVLNGALVAISPPETRLGNALSYWAELRRGNGR
jgi:CubicO group peptidase (beta-lactamase class C family)